MEKQPLNRIKVMLAERMLTNKQLAEMLGKDPATISKWVTNKLYDLFEISSENIAHIKEVLATKAE